MCGYETSFCPRCDAPFECKSGNVTECQCFGLSLNENTQEFLRTAYFDCLCATCLVEINRMIDVASMHKFPKHRAEFIEGLHYYIDKDNWVFTEFYHLQRGYCCGNACRHCAYGFVKQNVDSIKS